MIMYAILSRGIALLYLLECVFYYTHTHKIQVETITFFFIDFQMSKYYCEGGFHDEPCFSFLNFYRLVQSLQNFECECNHKKRS